MPRDTLQAYAATELYNRDWRYHKDLKLWFTKAGRQGAAETQKGQYIYFDINEWKKKMFHGAGGGAAGGGTNGTDVEGESAAGINVRKGKVTNILEESVVVPLLVHTSAISLATECVRLILKIDDIVITR